MQQSKLIRLPGATDSLSSPSLCTAPGTGPSWAISAHKTSRKLNLLPSFSTKKKESLLPVQQSTAELHSNQALYLYASSAGQAGDPNWIKVRSTEQKTVQN